MESNILKYGVHGWKLNNDKNLIMKNILKIETCNELIIQVKIKKLGLQTPI